MDKRNVPKKIQDEIMHYIGGVLGSTWLMANAIKVKNLRGDEYEQEH